MQAIHFNLKQAFIRFIKQAFYVYLKQAFVWIIKTAFYDNLKTAFYVNLKLAFIYIYGQFVKNIINTNCLKRFKFRCDKLQ